MLVDVTLHDGGTVQHNLFMYVRGHRELVKAYDVDFFSVWEVEDIVRDLACNVPNFKYHFKSKI